MAGGAADCGFWIRFLRSEAKFYESFHEGQYITVARASRILSNILYQNRELNLSLGTMLMGYDSREGFSIYYVDNSGVRIKGDMFAVGSTEGNLKIYSIQIFEFVKDFGKIH